MYLDLLELGVSRSTELGVSRSIELGVSRSTELGVSRSTELYSPQTSHHGNRVGSIVNHESRTAVKTHVTHQLLDVWLNLRIRRNDQCVTVVNILMLSTFIFLMPQHHWGLDLRGGSSSSDGEVSTTRPLEYHDDQSESRKGRSEGAGSRGSWGSGVSSLTVPLPVPTDSRQDRSSNQEEGPRHRARDEEGPRETFRGIRRRAPRRWRRGGGEVR